MNHICPICKEWKSGVFARGENGCYGVMCDTCFLDLADIADAIDAMRGEL